MNFPGRAPEVWWYSLWVLFGWGDEAGLGRVQPNCWNWTVHQWEGAAHTHLYGLMRGHGQIYLERESTDTRLEFRIVITDILTLIIHIWKAFVGIVSHSAFNWHTSQTQVSKWQRIFLPTIRLVLTMNSCIKLTESKRASHVPLGNSFSIKGALFLSDCLGRCYGGTETQQDTAQSLSLPLLSFFLSCTLEPCGSQVGVALAPGQPLTAPWSRPEGGQGSAWLGCSYTAPNRTSI